MSSFRNPKISVLMSAYNCSAYIGEAVRSICGQSYTDFELLILDDGSADGTWEIVRELAKSDSRIRIFENSENMGVAYCMNKLVDLSNGEYLAYMDADDIALPERFEKQVTILDSGKADICGGWMIVFGNGPEFLRSTRVEDEEIRAELLFSWPFCKPTVMARRELLARHRFNPDMVPSADYDVFARMAADAVSYNIPEPLVYYRLHPGQISIRGRNPQHKLAAEIAIDQLRRAGIACSDEECATHTTIVNPAPPETVEQVAAADAWMQKLILYLSGSSAGQRIVAMRWYRFCLKAAPLGPRVFRIFWQSPINRSGEFQVWQYLAVFVLSLFRIRRNSRLYRTLMSRSPASKVRT